jgi:hypothetical protein
MKADEFLALAIGKFLVHSVTRELEETALKQQAMALL